MQGRVWWRLWALARHCLTHHNVAAKVISRGRNEGRICARHNRCHVDGAESKLWAVGRCAQHKSSLAVHFSARTEVGRESESHCGRRTGQRVLPDQQQAMRPLRLHAATHLPPLALQVRVAVEGGGPSEGLGLTALEGGVRRAVLCASALCRGARAVRR